jgi:uncharacterized membrane protein HdeD (DUF308 family)
MGVVVTDREEQRAVSWWLFLVTGVLWLIFAFIVLSFDFKTVWAIALFAGFAFIAAGCNEFLVAMMGRSWRWAHALVGVLLVATGILAITWPDVTFLALAAVIGWFLLFQGTLDVVVSLFLRFELWWLRLIVGLAEILIAFWAIGYPDRSFVLLAVWVGAAALARGITQIALAFEIRSLEQGGGGAVIAAGP